jgi:hypothetical protein
MTLSSDQNVLLLSPNSQNIRKGVLFFLSKVLIILLNLKHCTRHEIIDNTVFVGFFVVVSLRLSVCRLGFDEFLLNLEGLLFLVHYIRVNIALKLKIM